MTEMFLKIAGQLLEAKYSLEMAKISVALLNFVKVSTCKNSGNTCIIH
jgi:hypothetical protein